MNKLVMNSANKLPKKALKSLIFVVALLFALWSFATQAKEIDPDDGFFVPKFGDWQSDAEEAKTAGKQAMFLFFEWSECPYCQKMLKTALRQDSVQEFFTKHFAAIRVDVVGGVVVRDFDGNSKTEKAVAKKYKVRVTPTLMLVDFDGKELYRHVGYFYEADEMIAFGKFLASEGYKTGQKYIAK